MVFWCEGEGEGEMRAGRLVEGLVCVGCWAGRWVVLGGSVVGTC